MMVRKLGPAAAAAALLSLAFLVCACSDGGNTPAGCEPMQESSCGGTSTYCGADRSCQSCAAGTFNCDGLNSNACESSTACGGSGCVSRQSGSTCGTTRYCLAQTCTSCAASSFNCDLNDTNGCEAATTCAPAVCAPSSSSSCGTSAYCVGKACTGCGAGTYNCDLNDSNGCEAIAACGPAPCTPNNAGASSCGTRRYCAGQTCTDCAAGNNNCDLNDGNACESTTTCGFTGHVNRGCTDNLYQVDVTEGATTCGTALVLEVQITVGETGGLPPAGGRTYPIKSPSQVNIHPADGEAIAVSLGVNKGNAQSGTLTVGPTSGGTLSGSYQLTLEGGVQVNGSFRADICPFDPSACQ